MNTANRRAADWIAAWNSHDIDRILALYADNAEMASPKIVTYGASPDGILRGKEKLRKYWSNALEKQPSLHFSLDQVFASPDSVVLLYTDHRDHHVCEYLQYGKAGEIIRAAAHHVETPR